MDPISIITIISAGLKLVDQFREFALRIDKKSVDPPKSKAEQVGDALEVSHEGTTYQTIQATSLKMDEWDATRYQSLNERIRTRWNIFHDLFASEAGASAMEGAKLREEMRKTKEMLCKDFKEMVKLYEATLGASLPDHYQLYEICS
jgi:hypothetical protein